MLPLAELQREFARGVLGGAVPALAFAGPIAPSEAMRIHRNTVIGALVNALRLSYASVDGLVGEETFDAMAAAFAERHPPLSARLIDYGAEFAVFVAQACPLPYLGDVARLDWAVERAAQAVTGARAFEIEGAVAVELPLSLTALRLDYAADLIRGALGDDDALAAIDLTPGARAVVVWRAGADVYVRGIGIFAGRFLAVLLASGSAAQAFGAALEGAADHAAVISEIQNDIFAASFCNVISNG